MSYKDFMKEVDSQTAGSRGHEGKIKKIIKAILKKPIGLTDDDEDYLRSILNLIQEGSITKKTLQKLNNAIKKEDIKGITGYELIKWCRKTLVSYKIPQYIEFRDMLPKSKVG